MGVFAVLPKESSPSLEKKITETFGPNDIYKISETQFLVSANLTAHQLSEKLNLTGPVKDDKLPIAVVLSVSNYFGKHVPELWEWLKVKMEKAS